MELILFGMQKIIFAGGCDEILFSMTAVSRSQRWVRGKVARYLAGKASIAVRIDHFNGQKLTKEQISEIHKEAESIKNKFPKPPKRK